MAEAGKVLSNYSIDGVKELYLVIVGLGVTSTLANIVGHIQSPPSLGFIIDFLPTATSESLWKYIAPYAWYIFVILGYFSIVFQFTLGTFNVLTAISEESKAKRKNRWSKSLCAVSVFFLLSAVFITLIGHSLDSLDYRGYCFYLILLFIADIAGLVFAHRPWDKQDRFRDIESYWDWVFFKSFYVLFFGVFDYKWYKKIYLKLFPGDPEKNPDHEAASEEFTKITHYWWCSSNIWTILYILLLWIIGWKFTPFINNLPNWFISSSTKEINLLNQNRFLLLTFLLLIFSFLNFNRK